MYLCTVNRPLAALAKCNMNTNIQIFHHELFGEIRTMTDEKGETFFVGKDVAEALGYSNTRKALSDHVDNEDREDGVTIRDAIGRERRANRIQKRRDGSRDPL